MNASVIRAVRFDIKSEAYTELCWVEAAQIFRDMVNEMLEYGLKNRVHNATSLEKQFYYTFKTRYRMATHYCTSASRFAAGLIKSHLIKLEKWKENGTTTEKPHPPKQEKLTLRLQTELAHIHWAEGNPELHITTKPRKSTTLELQIYPYAQSFLEAWRAGKLKMGEITITQSGVFVPFKQSLPLVRPAGVMFFDTNLNSLDFVVAKESGVVEGFSLDISLIQKIRERYLEKMARIQEIRNPQTRKKLLEKYRKRERRRVNHLLHIVSRIVAGISERYGGLYAVFGDLTEIRSQINRRYSSKELRRNLNKWPFRRLQRLCEFKLLQNPPKKERCWTGCLTAYTSEAYTSATCAVCKERTKRPRGQMFKCPHCGYCGDRHVVAALNMALKPVPMWLELAGQKAALCPRVTRIRV
ncbi:MAG: zinc ribbon domain-containing protein, partial [Candidatus Jordarchaeaceae archaeon]